MTWIEDRTGLPSPRPRVPRATRLVENGVEKWHVVEARPVDAQTDE
jgi:hypothetical protein